MQHITTRTELINFICENISQSAIVRACYRSKESVKVLGGFSNISPGTSPGWLVVVTSVHGRMWLVAVTSDDHKHVFRTWIAESIPWENYVGQRNRGEYNIFDGDNPNQAWLAKEYAR